MKIETKLLTRVSRFGPQGCSKLTTTPMCSELPNKCLGSSSQSLMYNQRLSKIQGTSLTQKANKTVQMREGEGKNSSDKVEITQKGKEKASEKVVINISRDIRKDKVLRKQ